VKGTKFLIDAVRELQTEGYKIELEIIEGIENKDAVHLYSRAHLAVDQLRTGWYGRFAVECLSRGVPVISYIRQSDLNLVPFKMAADLPILNANETTLKEMIRYAITLDKEDYENLRRKSFDYVATWHNVQNIADSLIRTYLRE
jgi:hypothetical protein